MVETVWTSHVALKWNVKRAKRAILLYIVHYVHEIQLQNVTYSPFF